jgi:hypothetical protein
MITKLLPQSVSVCAAPDTTEDLATLINKLLCYGKPDSGRRAGDHNMFHKRGFHCNTSVS